MKPRKFIILWTFIFIRGSLTHLITLDWKVLNNNKGAQVCSVLWVVSTWLFEKEYSYL